MPGHSGTSPLLSPLSVFLLVTVLAVLLWSGIAPHDRFTWFMEVVPVLIGLPILVFTYHRFRFTTLVYCLVALHMIILMVGGKYTYAEVPLGFWMEGWFGFARNHYDRIGHFAQGFVPALVARELFIRDGAVRRSDWLPFLVVCFCLALSASYELIEWLTAEITGSAADAFLGTQGDVWDTQWDMFFALVGAVTALVTLSGVHDRLLGTVSGKRVSTR
jgi:putative membrane protein